MMGNSFVDQNKTPGRSKLKKSSRGRGYQALISFMHLTMTAIARRATSFVHPTTTAAFIHASNNNINCTAGDSIA
jgi:hypothetical protein